MRERPKKEPRAEVIHFKQKREITQQM